MAILTAATDLARLRQSGQIAAQALRDAAAVVKPGVATKTLNDIAERTITQLGGQPAFNGYQGYPASLCVSVNYEVVHGIPKPGVKLKAGDLVSLDVGVNYRGIYTDHAITVAVGEISAAAERLMRDTKQALQLAIATVSPRGTIGDIGAAVQQYLEPRGYGIVRQLVGHGVGRALHEPPSIPNWGKPGTGAKLTTGMVLAIEPMITLGDWQVDILEDGWTVVTRDRSLAAHFEHTVLVTKDSYEIITVMP